MSQRILLTNSFHSDNGWVLVQSNLVTADSEKKISSQLQLKAAASQPFGMFPPPPFNMPVSTTYAEDSVTINISKIAGIGHSYIVFLGSFANSLCAVKVEQQQGVAKQEADVLNHLTGIHGVPRVTACWS